MIIKKSAIFGGLLTLLIGSAAALPVQAQEESLIGLTSSYMRFYIDSNDTINVINDEFVDDNLTLYNVDGTTQLLSQFTIANVQSYVNIRDDASIDGNVLGRLYKGAIATAVDSQDGWTKVISGDIVGYIKTDYLLFGEEAVAFANDYYSKYARVTSSTLNLRSSASLDASIVYKLPNAAELTILSKEGDWYKVSYQTSVNTLTGYVYYEYISTDYKYAMDIKDAIALDEKNSYDLANIIWPLPSDHNIYTYYGYRIPPVAGASSYHRGLDIGGASGSTIVAVLSGTVTDTGYNSSSGNYVIIDHGNGVCSRYYHCSKFYVSPGDKVAQGQAIAAVGSTGVATGPHLHFAMTINGSYVDPYPYLKNVQ